MSGSCSSAKPCKKHARLVIGKQPGAWLPFPFLFPRLPSARSACLPTTSTDVRPPRLRVGLLTKLSWPSAMSGPRDVGSAGVARTLGAI